MAPVIKVASRILALVVLKIEFLGESLTEARNYGCLEHWIGAPKQNRVLKPPLLRLSAVSRLIRSRWSRSKGPRTALAERWSDLIDIDAGTIATGAASAEEVGSQIFEFILEVASGRKQVCADQLNLHNDLALFNPAPIT